MLFNIICIWLLPFLAHTVCEDLDWNIGVVRSGKLFFFLAACDGRVEKVACVLLDRQPILSCLHDVGAIYLFISSGETRELLGRSSVTFSPISRTSPKTCEFVLLAVQF